MPIKINFLTEALAAEEMRRRDPVKRAFFLGGFLVALSFVWYSSTLLNYKIAQNSLDQVNDKIKDHSTKYSEVQANMRSSGENKRRLAALEMLSTNRFLQGNLLNALQKIYVPHVQLLRVRLDQTYTIHVPKKDSKKESTGKGEASPKSVEQIVLTLDAKDSSPNPGDQVNRYKDAIANDGYFDSNKVETADIVLSKLSPAQTSITGKPFVLFTLTCRYPETTR